MKIFKIKSVCITFCFVLKLRYRTEYDSASYMHLKPIKRRFFIGLNLVWLLVFLAIFVIILYSVNPFEANIFILIIFYIVLFCLLLGIFSLTRLFAKTPYWLIILLALCVIVILLILAN